MRVEAIHPRHAPLLWAVCALQVALIAASFFISAILPLICVLTLISAVALFGSITLSVLYLCFVAAVVPSWFYEDYLLLPLDFKFYEGLFALVMGMAALTHLSEGRWHWRRHTALDRPMCALLGLVVFSCVLGAIYGQSVSQMLRDVRYPLYYALFFAVTWFFDVRRAETFLYLFALIAAIVGIEYSTEFFLEVDTNIAGGFVRVARLEGIVLPMGILLVAAILTCEPRAYKRAWAWAALLPIGMALILTVGRSMWIALFVGLFALVGLIALDKRTTSRRALVIALAIPSILIAMSYVFQQQTRTALSDVARKRVTQSAEAIAGRFIPYGKALERIRQYPLLGGGHGQTVTFLSTFPVPEVKNVGGVDNVYLTIGMRMGLIGIAAFLWVYVAALRCAYRLFQRSAHARTRVFCAAFIAIYSALLVHGLADATLFVNRLIFIHATFLGLVARLFAEEDDHA